MDPRLRTAGCAVHLVTLPNLGPKYLVEKHGLSLLRVIGVDGGVREHWSVDLFVELQGKCGPLPRPELPRDEARFSGQCSER